MEASDIALFHLTDSLGAFLQAGVHTGASPSEIGIITENYSPDSLKYSQQVVREVLRSSRCDIDLFIQFDLPIAAPYFETRDIVMSDGTATMEDTFIGNLFDDEASVINYGMIITYPDTILSMRAIAKMKDTMKSSGYNVIKETLGGAIYSSPGADNYLLYNGRGPRLIISCFDISLTDIESLKSLLDTHKP